MDKRKDLYLIAINGSSTWTGPGGLRLGLSLADLKKLNRKPFKLRGFDKDNTATVSDWDHGALAVLSGLQGRCHFECRSQSGGTDSRRLAC